MWGRDGWAARVISEGGGKGESAASGRSRDWRVG